MGQKLYEEMQSGGIRFKEGRKPWEVRLPCYVYDLWLPIIGATALGVYGLYCRLARQGTVKAITLQDIATACRIGKSTLYKINNKLIQCQFITLVPPKGWQRLAHFTTEIAVLDPPEEVSAELIEALLPGGREYEPLTPWLVEFSEVPDRTPESPKQDAEEVPSRTPNVVTLGLEPLDVVSLPIGERKSDLFDLAQKTVDAREKAGGNYAVPPSAGGMDSFADGPLTAFATFIAGIQPTLLPVKDRKAWAAELRRIAKRWSTEERPITADIMEQAIKAMPDSDIGWKTYTSPHSGNFETDIGPLLLSVGETKQPKVVKLRR